MAIGRADVIATMLYVTVAAIVHVQWSDRVAQNHVQNMATCIQGRAISI